MTYKSIYLQYDDPFDRPPEPKGIRENRLCGGVFLVLFGLLLTTLAVPLVLRWAPPPTSAFMLQSNARRSSADYHWVSWEKMSRHLPIAVVDAEDQKFPTHWGFDLVAISKALDENKRRLRPRGASTISQQVAKNLFLWPGRSYIRKGVEAYFTVIIELMWSKRRILEVYLNIAQFGPGIFGVEAASRAYFAKPASRLRESEAALLAAVLPNPIKLKAAAPSDYVRQRVLQIEDQMDQLGGPGYLSKL
jgi:monofunctional biosynthetic peptidoglycan transglycosylase